MNLTIENLSLYCLVCKIYVQCSKQDNHIQEIVHIRKFEWVANNIPNENRSPETPLLLKMFDLVIESKKFREFCSTHNIPD